MMATVARLQVEFDASMWLRLKRGALMADRFQIRGPDGAVYELTDVEYFVDEYEPKGFVIVTNPPADHIVPDVRPLKAERRAKARAEEEKAAKAEAKSDAKADEKKDG